MTPALRPERLERLSAPARAALGRLAEHGLGGEFYLAGGAALALYLGHRTAHGLDLMSPTQRLAPADRRDLLAGLLAVEPGSRVETARDGYLYLELPGAAAVRLHWYPYPLVAPLEQAGGLPVASLVDLTLMKLGAVISRGTRRDFVDLHLACRVLPLESALARAEEKFGHVGDFALQAWKALADLAEAESEPMPELEVALEWAEVRAWALAEAARGGRAALANVESPR